ncbi:MAG TPA: hypothetical protein VML53_08345 [Thermoplasmata archaeon]|nr:hypothetical protein [Thermoplasmata archaeon]
MGVKRSFHRRKERELRDVLKHNFLPGRGSVKVPCGACGRQVPVSVPAFPKKGVRITVQAVCPCGATISLTLTGAGQGQPPGPKAP